MNYSVLLESSTVREEEGIYYAHVPSLGITTHGEGIEGAMAAARDLIRLWVEEKRESGETPVAVRESILATVEVSI